MHRFSLLAAAAFSISSSVSAQDVILIGEVQQVIVQRSGTPDCPPPCPPVTLNPDGSKRICISNGGGCQTMDVKIEHVYRGVANGETRRFKSRIGEWGPTFPVKEKRIVVSEAAGTVSWSPAIEQAGKIFIDPRRMRTIGGVPISVNDSDSSELAALAELLERVPTALGH
ncbi:hypothetical protein AB2N08_16345 [Massilia aurea]|uniref:hypothetical protein n=1 Tax=Massilia aurea TaxID=373040 RepID=UPI0034617DC4